MITTIDRAGRVVIPKVQREQAGLVNTVEITVEDGRVVVASPAMTPVRNPQGRLRLPVTGERLSVDDVRRARRDVQR